MSANPLQHPLDVLQQAICALADAGRTEHVDELFNYLASLTSIYQADPDRGLLAIAKRSLINRRQRLEVEALRIDRLLSSVPLCDVIAADPPGFVSIAPPAGDWCSRLMTAGERPSSKSTTGREIPE